MSLVDPREFERSPSLVVAFVDGACRGNPGPAASAAILVSKDGVRRVARFLGPATNNVAELGAVRLALDHAPPGRPLRIVLDSQYVEGILTKHWIAKANVETVADLRRRLASLSPRAEFRWVRGHVGNPGNDAADAMANRALDLRADLDETD